MSHATATEETAAINAEMISTLLVITPRAGVKQTSA
jgi:hypothetical protein